MPNKSTEWNKDPSYNSQVMDNRLVLVLDPVLVHYDEDQFRCNPVFCSCSKNTPPPLFFIILIKPADRSPNQTSFLTL